jgi:hypothetical protein
LLNGMTGNSLHMQWTLTSQWHGSVSQREQLVFCYGSNLCPTNAFIFEENKETMHIKPIIHTSLAMFSQKTFLLK